MTIATIKVMFHERVFSTAQRCNIFDKMVFVQVMSMLLHFALLYFPLKILGGFIRGKIRRVLFPYKWHISSKIRRDLAKTRLILEQPLAPVLR